MRRIDADALKAEWYEINDIGPEDCGARFVGYQEIARLIDNAPTVEPTGDYISRADAIDAVANQQDGSGQTYEAICHAIRDIQLLPSAELTLQTPQTYGKSINPSNAEVVSADAEPTVIRSKTLMPTKDFTEWAKRIKEENPNAIVIPCDAEVVSAVPQLKQTDTLIIADALRYLAKDTERHLVDRTRADALRQQFLKYGASMCKGGDTE